MLAVLMLFAWPDAHAQGCAMCKAVAESGAESDQGGISGGLNSGILYLMAIPYVIFFFVFRKRIFRFFRDMRDIYN